jgi:DNA-directed RNA polymerase specialized sigma subunit
MDRKDLKSFKNNQEWIKEQTEYIEQQKEQVNKLTSTLSDMPVGTREVQDSMAEKLSILMDNLDGLLSKILQEQTKQKKILEKIDKLEYPYKLILDKAYIMGKTLVTVASEMGYSYEDICRKHGTALRIFESNQ